MIAGGPARAARFFRNGLIIATQGSESRLISMIKRVRKLLCSPVNTPYHYQNVRSTRLSFLIRPAIESDALAVSELTAGLSEYFASGSVSQISQEFWDSISVEAVTGRIVSPDYDCFVAGDTDGLSGFVAFRKPSHLFHLFVASRAQSRGLGKLLWQKVLERSACPEITVNSSVFAIPFYQRLGFVRVGPDKSEGGISYSPMVFTKGS